MRVVISQPMFFPWIGMFEQIALADVYVHYTDVQYSKGSFTNRVQIKCPEGVRWLTVPLTGLKLGQRICEVHISTSKDWRAQHLATLRRAYAAAAYGAEMLDLVGEVYAGKHETIAELSDASLLAVCRYFGLDEGRRFVRIQDLGIPGTSSRRVLDVVKAVGGTEYITGHGARRYLDHGLFEREGVRVEYMDYQRQPYPQMHGEFTPFVSILDLITNEGRAGRSRICSGTKNWKEFTAHE